MTPDLSYYWEGGREECEDNKWDEKKRIYWRPPQSVPDVVCR